MKKISIDTSSNDRWSRFSFNQLIIQNPHIQIRGLFKKDYQYFIHIEDDLSTCLTKDGKNINEWFKGNKVMTSPTFLVNELPENAIKVDTHSITDLSLCKGEPHSGASLINELKILFPKKFRTFKLQDKPEDQKIIITFNTKFSRCNVKKIKKTLTNLQAPFKWEIIFGENINVKPQENPFQRQGIDIIPSHNYLGRVNNKLQRRIEFDEDFWLTNREKLFSSKIDNISQIVNKSWYKKELYGFINGTVNQYSNIRNFFTIYDKLIFALPLSSHQNEFFKSIGITENDFLKLYQMKKIFILAPQPVHRYTRSFLEKIIEINHEHILFSRQLSACSIVNTKNRFPFLYPNLGSFDRYELLHGFTEVMENLEIIPDKGIIQPIINSLSENFLNAERMIHQKGAMGTPTMGIGNILSHIHKSLFNRDNFLEFYSASSYIDWASPFNANIISPIPLGEYEEGRNIEILANFYSGLTTHSVDKIKLQNIVIDNILTVDNDIDITEFVNSFKSHNISKFREIVIKLQRSSENIPVEDVLEQFNREVKRFERKMSKLKKNDISGLIRSVNTLSKASCATLFLYNKQSSAMAFGSIPLLLSLSKILYVNRNKNRSLSLFFDYVQKTITQNGKDAILVSRIKNDLK